MNLFPSLFPALCLTVASPAVTLTDPTGGAIPDGSTSGLALNLNLDEPGMFITSITVSLVISGDGGESFNGDLFGYLSDGTTLVPLFNRVGRDSARPDGYDDIAGWNVTFDDLAITDFHQYRSANGGDDSVSRDTTVLGSFQPDGRTTSPIQVVTSDPRSAVLGDFVGLSAEREFTLFVADLANGNAHQVDGWSLEIETVIPEPGTSLMLLIGLGALVGRRTRGM